MSEQKDFIAKMLGELQYAEEKHNGFPADRVHASAILNEEAGKLTQACLDYHWGNFPPEADEHYRDTVLVDKMEKYALRVGAMALRFYNSLPARDGE